MSKTLLPLKHILEGDHRALIQAMRDVAQHDDASALQRTALTLSEMRTAISDTSLSPDTEIDNKNHTLLIHYFNTSGQNWSIYSTDSPIPLYMADKILTALFTANKSSHEIEHSLYNLSLHLIVTLAQRPEAISDTAHPLRQFIETLFQQVSIWEPAIGKPGKQIPNLIQQFIADFTDIDIQSNDVWQKLTAKITSIHDANQIRTQNLERRLHDSLNIDPEQQRQQQVVSRWINRKLNGKPLPDEVALFIRMHLISDVQYLLINQSTESALWSHWQKLLHVLSWVFKESEDTDFRTKARNVLLPIIEELDERYYQELNDHEKYDAFLGQLTEILIKFIQGHSISCSIFQGIVEQPEKVVVKQAVIKDHTAFSEGQWFLFHNSNNTTLRAKLILKSIKTDTLVFSNYLGKKVYECDFEQFSLQLATHSTYEINQQQLFKHALFKALKSLELLHRHNLKLKQQEMDAREASKSQAADKARHEAKQIEERKERERQEQERHIQVRSQLQPEILEVYQQTLKDLQVGAWVAIRDSATQVRNIKLSVKLSSTNRYIFTDRLGQPNGDLHLDELIDLMIDKRLDIISSGENFENKLEQIVKGLRKA